MDPSDEQAPWGWHVWTPTVPGDELKAREHANRMGGEAPVLFDALAENAKTTEAVVYLGYWAPEGKILGTAVFEMYQAPAGRPAANARKLTRKSRRAPIEGGQSPLGYSVTSGPSPHGYTVFQSVILPLGDELLYRWVLTSFLNTGGRLLRSTFELPAREGAEEIEAFEDEFVELAHSIEASYDNA